MLLALAGCADTERLTAPAAPAAPRMDCGGGTYGSGGATGCGNTDPADSVTATSTSTPLCSEETGGGTYGSGGRTDEEEDCVMEPTP